MARSQKQKHSRGRGRGISRDPLAVDRMFDRVVQGAFKITPPEVLYHYTTWASAEGILSSQLFWATAHNCTNDEAELVSADSMIIESVKDLRRNAVRAAAQVLDLFLANYAKEQITLVIPVYLACFSALRDDKEQWTRYGDNGYGVCLGIRVLDEQPPASPEFGSALVKVDYSESSWRESVRGNMGKVCAVLERARELPKNVKLALSALYRIAAFASIMAKQPRWEVEQEFRHVTIVHPDAKIEPKERQSGCKTIRYLPVLVRKEGKRIAFAEITIGPNRDVEDSRSYLEGLLADNGYRVGDIEYPHITVSAAARWHLGK
jgi:hypothetical protein